MIAGILKYAFFVIGFAYVVTSDYFANFLTSMTSTVGDLNTSFFAYVPTWFLICVFMIMTAVFISMFRR